MDLNGFEDIFSMSEGSEDSSSESDSEFTSDSGDDDNLEEPVDPFVRCVLLLFTWLVSTTHS